MSTSIRASEQQKGESSEGATPVLPAGLSAGLEAKFTSFYLETRPDLRAYLTNFVRSQEAVEDCLQEACVVLWDKMTPEWELLDFRKMAFVTGRFKALSWLKKNKPAIHSVFSPELADKLAMQSAKLSELGKEAKLEKMEALRHCLGTLPKKQRVLMESCYDAEKKMALSDYAKKAEKSLDAVYKQIERIRTGLRNCIQERMKSER